MKLTLNRVQFEAACTIGQLLVDGNPACYTLEDLVRAPGAPKVFGQTAIPAGTYRVIVDHSEHFGRDLPHILDVPGFEGIRIHAGNTAADTSGCILVGMDRLADSIGRSRLAFEPLFGRIQGALAAGQTVSIEVR